MSEKTPTAFHPVPSTRLGLRRFRNWLIGLLLLSGLIVVVTHWVRIEQFIELARQARPLWLLLGLFLQIGTYFSVAAAWQLALQHAGTRSSFLSLVRLAVAKLFSDQAMPSGGISGTAFLIAALHQHGIPHPICLATLLASIVTSYAASLVAAIVSIALLGLYHELRAWILIIAGLFCLAATAIPACAIWLQHWGKHSPNLFRRIPMLSDFQRVLAAAPANLLRSPLLMTGMTLFQAAVILLDAATLWIMLLAVGQQASFWVALPGFVLASMAAKIGPIPLGLGTFETTCVAVLSMLGVPISAALAAALLLRGFSVWLPMLPGMWLARREFSQHAIR
jgi:glycosyltransferase 2 family protein